MVVHEVLALEAVISCVVSVYWGHRWVPPCIMVHGWGDGFYVVWDNMGCLLG